jgi:butyryl-CoA dehydrogenase
MTYRAPVEDIVFTLRHVAGLDRMIADGLAPELEGGMAEAVLSEAGKFANDRIAPLNRIGDQTGSKLKDGVVTTPPGWKQAYRDWAEAGWNGLPAPVDFGGQGLPMLVQAACIEMWNSANMAFSLGPLLTAGAIEALDVHGSDTLKDIYLPKLVSGEWMGTMNLTEPQAGSDLAALRSRAEKQPDGTYRIFGQKIYITYGEHDLTDNIVHLVLARLPDAPAGTRGISLFLVPKFLVNADGSLGARNDVFCNGIEHKLGIHASPTCTMVYGDKGGAIGYLIGEENRGLNCMFTMMNNARLGVALQGVAVAEAAFQKALSYARERKQGKAAGYEGTAPIIGHPDIRRTLLQMRGRTRAARAITYMTAEAIDRAHREIDPSKKQAAAERAALLTPIGKSYATDIGIEVSSLGVQVHGGMGYVEETGAAQFLRDARIAAIYEGTNGIQAIDLVTRKLSLSGGETVRAAIAGIRQTVAEVKRRNDPAFGKIGERLAEAADSLEQATHFMLAQLGSNMEAALAGATPYLKLFALAEGGAALAREALAAPDAVAAEKIAVARFYAKHDVNEAAAIAREVIDGSESVPPAEVVFGAA